MDKWGGGEGAKAKGMLTWTPLKLLVGGGTYPSVSTLCRCPDFCHLKLFVYYPLFVAG